MPSLQAREVKGRREASDFGYEGIAARKKMRTCRIRERRMTPWLLNRVAHLATKSCGVVVAATLREREGGRGGEIRTRDLLVPNQALYQAKLRPDVTAGGSGAHQRAGTMLVSSITATEIRGFLGIGAGGVFGPLRSHPSRRRANPHWNRKSRIPHETRRAEAAGGVARTIWPTCTRSALPSGAPAGRIGFAALIDKSFQERRLVALGNV